MEDTYHSYDDLDEDEDQAFVRGGYFKQKKPPPPNARPPPPPQRHHPHLPSSREVLEDEGQGLGLGLGRGHGASPGLGREVDREGVLGTDLNLALAMDQFTIERKHYTPTSAQSPPHDHDHDPPHSAAAAASSSSSSSSSISPKKSLSLHKMLATHHYHTPGGGNISSISSVATISSVASVALDVGYS